MKPIFVIAVMLALAATTQARIGETEAELSERYGKPILITPYTPGDDSIMVRTYRFKDFDITVVITGGRSASENYQKTDHSEIALDERMTLLYASIAKIGGAWRANGAYSALQERYDHDIAAGQAGPLMAIYDRSSQTLTVTSKEFFERIAAVNKSQKEKALSGF